MNGAHNRSRRGSAGRTPGAGRYLSRRAGSMNVAIGLPAMILAGAVTVGSALAAEEHDFRICSGYYALCAASTCSPTGKTITVNVSGGGTARFPEAECTCPVEAGDAIADVVGGNMQGSCQPPGRGEIWSLYDAKKYIPQEINRWVTTGPAAQAPLQYCSKDFNLGSQLVNCFSFACSDERYINGVPVVTCDCPIGEGLEGTAVAPHTGFVTQAGQDDYTYCGDHPVGGPISMP
jgi:hypothetical protein